VVSGGVATVWTPLDLFERQEGRIRLSFAPQVSIYHGGDELEIRARAIAGDGAAHELDLHAVLRVDDAVFFYPDWDDQNTGVSVSLGPGTDLDHELVHLVLPGELSAADADLFAYLSDQDGMVYGNITRWRISLR
jgi:hypothetical protein